MAYEALYRRYRPSQFRDVFGQSHVVSALRNAVEGDRVGHAYLFSGPRGTGKTTSARLLAKALNCTDLHGGEPCDKCDSCLAFQAGGSYDLHELDAASNNGVDAMRDLIGKVALGSPGRTKVYILDEVHMLTAGAENALLKTLEEPPPHVVFVLATTEPNKVVPTIRSRTQHLEFSLLSADEIGALVDYVVGDAGLDITDEDRSYVIRAGGGSARDTLSALDQVVAAGGAPQGGEHLDALFEALSDRDSSAALTAIDGALQAGRDPAAIAMSILADLRSVFLAAMRADVSHLPEAEQTRAGQRVANMSPARVTRAIEVIGTSVVEMRQAPDPRVDLEVAVIRLTRPDLDVTPAALLERIEALEQGRGATAGAAPAATISDHAAAPTVESPQATEAAPVVETSAAGEAPIQATEATPIRQDPAPQDAPSAPAGNERPAAAPQEPSAPPTVMAPPSETQGKRGADMVRAALAAQDAPREPQPVPMAVQAVRADLSDAPKLSRTLADVRAERRAAPQTPANEDTAAPSVAPTNEAPAPARLESPPTAPVPTPDAPGPAEVIAEAQPTFSEPPVGPEARDDSGVQPISQPTARPPGREDSGSVETLSAADVYEPAPGGPTASNESGPVEAPDIYPSSPDSAASVPGGPPSLSDLEAAWKDGVLESLSLKARSRFTAGRFVQENGQLGFALPNSVHRDRCEDVRAEFDEALAARFAQSISLPLVVDTAEVEPDIFDSPRVSADKPAQAEPEEEEVVDLDGLVDATDQAPSGVERVLATFEGSELVDPPPSAADRP